MMSSDLKSNDAQNNIKQLKSSDHKVYGFHDFRLDVTNLMLYHQSNEIPLTPKQADTLLALIEHQGEIVSKEKLMHRLWGDSAVEESNLIQNIYVLRKVLGDTPDGRPMIETLRRRGYRFNAGVTEHHHWLTEVSAAIRRSDLERAFAATEPEDINIDRRPADNTGARWSIAAAIAGVVLLAGAVAVGYLVLVPRPVDAGGKKIAVLPLKPLDPANRNILYEIGVADLLINRLKDVDGLVVRPLSSVRKYADSGQNYLSMGQELHVDYVLASNYQLADGRIKVSTELVNVETGRVEDSITSSKDSASLFLAQDAIAADIGDRMVRKFSSDPSPYRSKRGTANEEAYTAYLLAMNLSEERGIQNVLKCLEFLERAVALDPNYANAWAAIALTRGDLIAHTDAGQHEHYQRSIEAINKALDIDPQLSAAYSARCYFKNRYLFDVAAAETDCKYAIELDPDSPLGHKMYANFLYTRGRFDEAVAEIKTAIDIQPVSYKNQQIYGLTLYFARRYPEAETQFKRLLEINPTHNYINGQLVTILDAQGKESEAFEYLIKSLAFKKVDNATIQRFKAAYARSGRRAVLEERIKTPDAEGVPGSFRTACLYAQIGDKDKAFHFLEKAFEERSFRIAVLQVEPMLDPLRSDPRYDHLLKRIGYK